VRKPEFGDGCRGRHGRLLLPSEQSQAVQKALEIGGGRVPHYSRLRKVRQSQLQGARRNRAAAKALQHDVVMLQTLLFGKVVFGDVPFAS